jgi:hypothetical protein
MTVSAQALHAHLSVHVSLGLLLHRHELWGLLSISVKGVARPLFSCHDEHINQRRNSMNFDLTLSEAVNLYHIQRMPGLRNYIDQLALDQFLDGNITREDFDLLLLELTV